MKLYIVEGITIRDGNIQLITVAKNEEDAKEEFIKTHADDYWFLQIVARELYAINGYKIEVKK